MAVTVRPAAEADLPLLADLWRVGLPHDPMAPDRLDRVLFDGRDPHGAWISPADGEPAGFAAAAAPAGGPGWLKAFVVRPDRPAAGPPVLAAAQAFLAGHGCRAATAPRAEGRAYLVAGYDLRYEPLLAALHAEGWTDVETIQDAVVDLASWEPNPRQLERERTVRERAVEVRRWYPGLLDAMRPFAAEVVKENPSWFPPGWEGEWSRPRSAVVAVKDGRIVAYAEYAPQPERGWFGPTATLEDLRDTGIGTAVLTASMRALKEAGTPRATAHWVWPPEFYLKSGWSIGRRYAVLERRFEEPGG